MIQIKKHHLILGPILVISLVGLAFLYGCGSNPSGGGSSGGAGPNNGTISGHTYILNQANWTLTGTGEYIIIVTREAMSVEATTVSTSDGSFRFTGLPAGEVSLTISKEYGMYDTFVANSDTFNNIVDYIADTGTATIRGTIEGLAALESGYIDGTLDEPSANIPSGHIYDYNSFVDINNLTYEVTNAPAEGETYIGLRFRTSEATGTRSHYAYARHDTSGGGIHYQNITFEAPITIEAMSIIPPAGYTTYTVRASVYKNNKYLANDKGDWIPSSATNGKLSGVMPLKSGDTYCITVRSTVEGDMDLSRYFYGRTAASGQSFDSSSPVMPTGMLKYPINASSISGVPTFEWKSVPDASYYRVQMGDDFGGFSWYAYTNNTKITLPAFLLGRMVSGHTYRLYITAYRFTNSQPISQVDISGNAYLDWMLKDSATFEWH